MRSLRAALLFLLLSPGAAFAAEATIVTRDVPLGQQRTTAASAPERFDLVGLHWQGRGSVSFRTRRIDGAWSRWRTAAPEAEDAPDRRSREASRGRTWRIGNPYWTGDSDRIEYRLRGQVSRLRAYFVSSPASRVPLRRVAVAGSPAVLTRLAWGANERIRRGAPAFAKAIRFALVHHTAGSNNYAPEQSAAIVRAIQLYHVRGNGWNDVGYNFLVDKYGQIFEGRYGGMTRNVVGAHAQGFNSGSVGVAVIGGYASAAVPAAAVRALTSLLAWRLDVAHVEPASALTAISAGNPRYPAGVPVFLRTISGHRDTGFTSCPGNALYGQLGTVAARVAATGLPKLYSPRVRGSVGSRVSFAARLSKILPWSVTVRDGAGSIVAGGSGTSSIVDWIWDARSFPRRPYAYTIEAGPAVRPATGSIGGTLRRPPPPPLLSGVSSTPEIVAPVGEDGEGGYATLRITLGAAALVTAELIDDGGTALATLLTESRPRGTHALRLRAAGLVDGRYTLRISAETVGGRRASTALPFVVSRVLRAFTVEPALFSPNGDGALDRTRFGVRLSGRARVTARVIRGATVVAEPFSRELAPGWHLVRWNGTTDGARVRDGRYDASVTVEDDRGVLSLSTPITIDTKPPRLRLLSLAPLRVWLSEPARVVVTIRGRRLGELLHAGASTFPYRGVVRSLQAYARDLAGNRGNLVSSR